MKTKLLENLKHCILISVEKDALNKVQELDEDFERFENTTEIFYNKESIGEVSYIAYKETFYKGRSYDYDTPPSYDEYNVEVHEIFNIKVWSENGNECKNISEFLNQELILKTPLIF